ncbi:MAG: hypothetical protein A2Z20_05695 [Bdellovibrionales bacterium RBG_16_40_8]|nr:MAG: hypothetical protein A2Z20_05695 [Bdellovibrionales bacterium RBG_16_40_8]
MAQVVEHVSAYEFIVSFNGDLVRVRNESLQSLGINDKVLVRVVATLPLAVQLVYENGPNHRATRINVTA